MREGSHDTILACRWWQTSPGATSAIAGTYIFYIHIEFDPECFLKLFLLHSHAPNCQVSDQMALHARLCDELEKSGDDIIASLVDLTSRESYGEASLAWPLILRAGSPNMH